MWEAPHHLLLLAKAKDGNHSRFYFIDSPTFLPQLAKVLCRQNLHGTVIGGVSVSILAVLDELEKYHFT